MEQEQERLDCMSELTSRAKNENPGTGEVGILYASLQGFGQAGIRLDPGGWRYVIYRVRIAVHL